MVTDKTPDAEQYTLTFMIAGAVAVGVTEVTRDNRTVDCCDNFTQPDLGRGAGQEIASADATLRPHQAGPFERQQDLFEVRLGQCGALSDVPDRRRAVVIV